MSSEQTKKVQSIDRIADDLFNAVEQTLTDEAAGSVSDEAVQKMMTAAIKLYHRKSTAEGRAFLPVVSEQALTPTEAVQGACELIRAVNLNPFDLALWYSRPRPDSTPGGTSGG